MALKVFLKLLLFQHCLYQCLCQNFNFAEYMKSKNIKSVKDCYHCYGDKECSKPEAANCIALGFNSSISTSCITGYFTDNEAINSVLIPMVIGAKTPQEIKETKEMIQYNANGFWHFKTCVDLSFDMLKYCDWMEKQDGYACLICVKDLCNKVDKDGGDTHALSMLLACFWTSIFVIIY